MDPLCFWLKPFSFASILLMVQSFDTLAICLFLIWWSLNVYVAEECLKFVILQLLVEQLAIFLSKMLKPWIKYPQIFPLSR